MAGVVAEGGRGGAVVGGRGGAVEEVGVVGYLRRPCLSFCRICRGIRSRLIVTKDSILVHCILGYTAMHCHGNTQG